MTKNTHKKEIDLRVKNLAKELFYENFNLKMSEYCKFTKEDVLDVVTYSAFANDYIENSANEISALSKSSISPDVIFYHLKDKKINDNQNDLMVVNDKILKKAKKKGLFKKPVTVAIDFTSDPDYSKNPSIYSKGTNQFNGTKYAYTIASIEIVEEAKRYTLASMPVNVFNNTANIIRRLILIAIKYVEIECILLDRGFFNVDVINTLYELGMLFVMPAIRNSKIKTWIKDNAIHYYYEEPYKMGNKYHHTTFNLVMVDNKKEKPRVLAKDNKFVYSTNIAIGKIKKARFYVKLYDARWGIETGYRVKDDFMIKTRTRRINVRMLFYMLTFILYNLWILANFGSKRNKKGRFYYIFTVSDMRIILKAWIINKFDAKLPK